MGYKKAPLTLGKAQDGDRGAGTMPGPFANLSTVINVQDHHHEVRLYSFNALKNMSIEDCLWLRILVGRCS